LSGKGALHVFRKVLIANRGEIALRILRACRELGFRTVAVHSTADADALHVRLADESVCIGPPPSTKSYLHIPAIMAAAEVTGADAIHPGYGFLSENAEFAEVCRRCRITFIGPSPEAMRAWGDKVSARANAQRFGLPLLPGTSVLRDAAHAREEAQRIGYPVILKASGGGGGRGMKIVRNAQDIENAFLAAQSEALAGFRNPDVYLERYIETPRHIEFQVVADQHGNAVCLGERECSIQRRHQKLLEEAPSPSLSPSLRAQLSEALTHATRETGYTSLGTMEFLLDERGEAYFMEMNTRVQVEHPVTEMVVGVDLVAEQILLARGARLRVQAHRIAPRGHSIECRINAEDPVNFAPSPGLVTTYLPPGGLGVRVDSGVYAGWRVPPHYDSLLAKLIVHASDRAGAIARMRRALDEFVVEGVKTSIPLHRRIMEHPRFQRGDVSTRFLEQMFAES
jgi:acetyl-CoA carboxylase biotin carboxylase subunit